MDPRQYSRVGPCYVHKVRLWVSFFVGSNLQLVHGLRERVHDVQPRPFILRQPKETDSPIRGLFGVVPHQVTEIGMTNCATQHRPRCS